MDRNIVVSGFFDSPIVALRKESVDRNYCDLFRNDLLYLVALRKESVDRNQNRRNRQNAINGRSPQGERG